MATESQTTATPPAEAQNGATENVNINSASTDNGAAPATPATPTNGDDGKSSAGDANTITLTDEQMKFINANGGMDKIFPKMKSAVSTPQKTAETTSTTPTGDVKEGVEQQANNAPQQPRQHQQGVVTWQEMATQNYMGGIAAQEKYAPIADKIRSGEVLKVMKSYGANPVQPDGSLNVQQLTAFLDDYVKTVPAQTPTNLNPADSAPTVEYVGVTDGKIENAEQARAIVSQSIELRAKGQAAHPNLEDAKKFLKDQIMHSK